MNDITSLVMKKMQFNQFPIMSMGAFCCHGNQTKKQITIILAILNCPYPSHICTKLESYCFSCFEGVVIYFFNLILPWQPNKMAADQKTHTLGRQSLNVHVLNIVHITSLVMEIM